MAQRVNGAPHHDRPLLALLIRLGAIAGLATMSALIKKAGEHGVHVAEIMFWRQAVAIPLILGWAALTGGIAQLKTARPRPPLPARLLRHRRHGAQFRRGHPAAAGRGDDDEFHRPDLGGHSRHAVAQGAARRVALVGGDGGIRRNPADSPARQRPYPAGRRSGRAGRRVHDRADLDPDRRSQQDRQAARHRVLLRPVQRADRRRRHAVRRTVPRSGDLGPAAGHWHLAASSGSSC